MHTCCTPRALPPTVTTADQPGAHGGRVHIGHEAYAPNIRSHTRVLKDTRQAMRSQPQQPPHRTRRRWRVHALRAFCTLILAICGAQRAARPMQPILQQILWRRRTKGGKHTGTMAPPGALQAMAAPGEDRVCTGMRSTKFARACFVSPCVRTHARSPQAILGLDDLDGGVCDAGILH